VESLSKIEGQHLWCPIDLVIHVIGSRWTIAIVRELATGFKRPSELARVLGKISAKTLTQRLRDLEEWGLVERTAFQEIPPRVEYSLTERGKDLLYVLEALKDLGESWQRSLSIQVPPTVKEQCSHCFEYLGRAENSKNASSVLQMMGPSGRTSATCISSDGHVDGDGDGNGNSHGNGHGIVSGEIKKLCQNNPIKIEEISTN